MPHCCPSEMIQILQTLSKVDHTTKARFEEQLDYGKLPQWSDCAIQLNRRYQYLAAEESTKSKVKSKADSGKAIYKSSFSCAESSRKSEPKCLYCSSADHNIGNCQSFTAMAFAQRFDFVKAHKLCINCLKPGHTVTKCKTSKCRVCSRPHHTVLHRYDVQVTSTPVVESPTSQAFASHVQCTDQVLLATALIKIRDRTGQFQPARALLDSGSQVNFMSENLAQRLHLHRENSSLNIVTVGKNSTSIKHKVHTTVQSRINAHNFNADFWILGSISSYQPGHKVSSHKWNIPPNIELADPDFYRPAKVDILLGAEIFFELLCVGQIKLSSELPAIQKTLLGWVVSGKCSRTESSDTAACNLTMLNNQCSLDKLVERFWELEQVPTKSKATFYTAEQEACEQHYKKNVVRLPSGRFEVKLPFKIDPSVLGQSYETARRRFQSLERRLQKDKILYDMYNDFMREYRDLGHMSPFMSSPPGPHYYIPHQCVLRPESTTTQLRVVFDASSKTSTSVSLNETLMVGATIQRELYSTLIRFRLHRYVITADISKMYRQVNVAEADRKFQLVLWRENASQDVRAYCLNTVTYGTASAPFLAVRCLSELADLYNTSHPVGAAVIKNDFYVDDMLAGASSLSELKVICKEVEEVLELGGFKLAKWATNHPNLFETISSEKDLQLNIGDSVKALGMIWSPRDDSIHYRLKDTFESLAPTKRNILSVAARLFDPLGLLCPIITRAKMLLQILWQQKIDWDESIPMHLYSEWERFKANLRSLSKISIPRGVCLANYKNIEIHGFSDASSHAYGCCIYVRASTGSQTEVKLLTAKSRVAPLKTKSIPRLELCAAHLLAKLWEQVEPMVEKLCITSVTFWSDSQVVLYWLKRDPSTLAVFVANRVAEVQELSNNATWRHVPSECNPSELLSRGTDIDELVSSFWFNGPEFLSKSEDEWPQRQKVEVPATLLGSEDRKSATVHTVAVPEPHPIIQLINKFSVLTKLVRIMAYVNRFVYRTKGNDSMLLSASELRLAFFKLVEAVQSVELRIEIADLAKSKVLCSNLQRLNPFLDEFQHRNVKLKILRVGGRLLNAPIPYETKFPMLLPRNTRLSQLLIRNLHLKNHHAGAKVLMSLLREDIWLINAREACKRIVRECVHCFRYKPKLLGQIMGNLPQDRVRPGSAFAVCGVDLFGPVFVSSKVRGRPPIKTYVAIFVCFTSKAVHIEPIGNLSTDCFLNCFKRFTGRRGAPERIYSDNATNFTGASNVLKELQAAFVTQQQGLVEYAAEKGTEWVFIPPRAPHFGGLWEAAVKSAKQRLLRGVGNANLTQEDLNTHLVDIEALLNSRPITALSNDPNDGEALTPGHLLIGRPLLSLPHESEQEGVTSKASFGFLKQWRQLSALRQQFWRSWSKDYLLDLQQQTQWATQSPNLVIGSLVLIHEDNLPPQRWLTGRVTRVITGDDNKVRVAEVRTSGGIMKRPIHKLALLPVG